jgi:hypothetical protein
LKRFGKEQWQRENKENISPPVYSGEKCINLEPIKVIKNENDNINLNMYQFNVNWYAHTPKLCCGT